MDKPRRGIKLRDDDLVRSNRRHGHSGTSSPLRNGFCRRLLLKPRRPVGGKRFVHCRFSYACGQRAWMARHAGRYLARCWIG
jgi:hypothetical protein